MKDNTIVMLAAVAGLSALGCLAIAVGDTTIAAGAGGALAGLVGGHLNGIASMGGSDAETPPA